MGELILVLAVVAAACAVPGVFLVLRRAALVSDAIGHTLILGIVLAYFATRDVDSPWLLVGAALTGLLTVVLVELLQRTRLVKADAAIGLVFPALFALGVVLVSVSHVRSVHLDIDAVLLGQPDLATVPRWRVAGVAVPPVWVMGAVLAANVGLCGLLFKELKLSTFDPGLAASLGFRPGLMHYGLMAVVSVTAVAAFDAVGPVLVVGFFVVPAATAYLLTDRLAVLIGLACGVGAAGAGAGVYAADRLDTNTAGAVAAALGGLFGLAFLFAPQRGQVALLLKRWERRRAFEETMLAVHLYGHEGTPAEADEARCDGLHRHLNWTPARVAAVVERATDRGLVVRAGEVLKLTEAGRERARAVFGESVAA
ncbi:MAG: metal ABC transporter permease [Isosphaera sp.]|nr:metal ABC transporter permease [Isosphaera sp.]